MDLMSLFEYIVYGWIIFISILWIWRVISVENVYMMLVFIKDL